MKLLAFLLCLLLLPLPAESKEKDRPPYGANFGQIFDITEHKSLARRGNVRSVKLKTADRPDDTEELRAEICDEHGLQIITWRSYIRALGAATTRHAEIAKSLTKKYGKPTLKRGSAFWKATGFVVVAKIRNKNNIYQNQIRYFGPKNDPCFQKFRNHLQQRN